jgi:hypothetical protein
MTLYQPYVQTYFPARGSLTQVDEGPQTVEDLIKDGTFAVPAGLPTRGSLIQVDEGPQTVEDLIKDGVFAIPAGEPETAILEDKKHTSWLALDDAIGQARQRWDLYEQNVLDIKWAQCYAFNEFAKLGWPPTVKQLYSYDKRLQELHAEHRAERISAWRDVSELRQALPESIREYLSAYRRSQLLNDLPGDEP